MKIMLLEDGTADIYEADNFKAFNVQAGAGTDVSTGFVGVVALADDEHAWIDLGWLKNALDANGGDRRAKLDAMLAFAWSKGWIMDSPPAVRGHIEWTDGS